MIFYTIVCVILQWCQNVESQNASSIYTLIGDCPDVKLQESLDYTRFSGHWYNVASYASDKRNINDCATLEFQEDNLGYTLRETFVEPDTVAGNRTQKTYFARVDPTFDAGNKAKFVISYENGDNVQQYPFVILNTDYDNYAITYTCKNMGRKARMHYVFVWVLTRIKEKLDGQNLKKVEDALSKYPELVEQRKSFVFKDFNETSCAFNIKQDIDSFSSQTLIQNLTIICTNNTSYAVLYNCKDGNEDAWIYSRGLLLTPEATAAVNDCLDKYNIDKSKLIDTDHSAEACTCTQSQELSADA